MSNVDRRMLMQLLYLNTNDATKVHLAIFKLGVLGRYLPQFKEKYN